MTRRVLLIEDEAHIAEAIRFLLSRDGCEVQVQSDGNAALEALPVLMLTAKGQGRDREAATRAGVSAFMTKPFANAEIRAAVRDLLGG